MNYKHANDYLLVEKIVLLDVSFPADTKERETGGTRNIQRLLLDIGVVRFIGWIDIKKTTTGLQ